MVKQSGFIFCFLFFVVCSSCNLFDSNSEPVSEKILHKPPFEAISDSIEDSPKDVGLLLRRAEMLMQKKYPELASRDYEKVWDMQHDEQTALVYAASLFMSGKEIMAIDLLKQCIQKFPGNPEFPRRLSEAYLQNGNKEEALKEYATMIEKDPYNFEAWYEKGIILADLKDTAAAIQALEKAYSLQPLQLFGVSLANLYAETKNPKTLLLCNELISRDSAGEFIDPIYLKGVYFANTNQPKPALEQFEVCISRDWKFVEAYIEKGIIFYEEKKYDEALKIFELAASVSNTYADAYFWIGRCYEAKGNKEEARKNYYKALSLDRNFAEAAEALERVK